MSTNHHRDLRVLIATYAKELSRAADVAYTDHNVQVWALSLEELLDLASPIAHHAKTLQALYGEPHGHDLADQTRPPQAAVNPAHGTGGHGQDDVARHSDQSGPQTPHAGDGALCPEPSPGKAR